MRVSYLNKTAGLIQLHFKIKKKVYNSDELLLKKIGTTIAFRKISNFFCTILFGNIKKMVKAKMLEV